MFIFSYLSIVLDLAANIPYVVKVIKKDIRPHAFTWLIWTILTAIIAIIQLNEGAGGGAWLLINTTLFNTVITFYAFKGGVKYADKKDYIVLIFCLLCIPLYFYFDLPFYAALVITLIDALSFIPTIRKAVKDPHGDSAMFQGLQAFAYTSSILAMDKYSIETCLFPVVICLMHSITCSFLVILRQRNLG